MFVPEEMKVSLDPALLEILACPACHGDVLENSDGTWLKCAACGLLYPIRDGIPVMLLDEAEKAADESE